MKTSVVICVYNGEKFIAEQLNSIINQSRPVDEIILCNDKSTDNTLAIVEDILNSTSIEATILNNESNMGALYSFEKGIKASSGDIIFLSDQDDSWLPDRVQLYCDFFMRDTQALAVFSNGNLIDDASQILDTDLWSKWNFSAASQAKWRDNTFAFSELVHNRNVITGATLAFKRELISLIIPFDLPFTYWHDSWIGIVAAGLNGLRFISQPTIAYRIHSAQQVGVSLGASDKKYQYINQSDYFKKLAQMFPSHKSSIYAAKRSIATRFLDKLRKLKTK